MPSKRNRPKHLANARRQRSAKSPNGPETKKAGARARIKEDEREGVAKKSSQVQKRRRNVDKQEASEPVVDSISSKSRWTVATVLGVAGVLSYLPTLYLLTREWDRLPDYSHGYLVIPFSIILAWLRRDQIPELSPTINAIGLVPIALSVVVRWVGAAYFVDFVDGISILLWVCGAVWMICGLRFLWWGAPSVAFLLFMIPLPYSINLMVSWPLQRVATKISTYLLQLLGQPALAEGNTIVLDTHVLEVAQACSGLRIFVGILALAFFIVFMTPRSRFMNVLIVGSVLPIALLANSLRIVATGLLMQYASTETAQKFSHDLAGWIMIPVACVMFALFMWYVGILFPRIDRAEIDETRMRRSPQTA